MSRFLAANRQSAMHLTLRLVHVALDARLHDLRPAGAVAPAVYDKDDHAAARSLGRRLHAAGSAGLACRSVREAGGPCAGLFRPRGARGCVHAAHRLYAWDGQGFSDICEKTE